MHLPWRPMPINDGPPILTSLTGSEAAKLADLANGGHVLEIGAAYGYSSIVMALTGARVLSVDPHQWMSTFGPMLMHLDRYHVLSHVELVREQSETALPRLVTRGQRFDLIFIDGDHVAPAVESDLMWSAKLLTDDGVIALHDYTEDCCCPDVRAVADRLHGPATDADVTDTLRVIHVS